MRFASTAFTALLLVARSQSSAFGVVGKSSRRSLASIAATTTSKRQITSFLKSNKHSVCPAAALPFFRGGALSPAFSTQLRTSTTTAEPETAAPVEVFRKDYTPLPFTVQEANLDIIINPGETTVHTEMKLIPNPASVDKSSSLLLDGEQQAVTLREISMDGKTLQEGTDYKLTPTYLEVYNIPSQGAVLKTTVTTVPEDNTQLSGLYKSGSMYCSQMEALGFRRMTYYPDRPDNMAVFKSVRIEADKKENPVLLSNGNLIQEGDVNDSRHFAIWSDPFPKPCYLFAVVAGDLGKIEDTYTTMSGRKVQLQVFSEHNNVEKLEYAMESLKRSMKWDEDRFGLEYDLDLYNIVAVESFNMGAMENKGLNIFNTAYVLADREQSTDTDFERVEGVIGHEYFHNWTGNRVTCRDWFQLTLKGTIDFKEPHLMAP